VVQRFPGAQEAIVIVVGRQEIVLPAVTWQSSVETVLVVEQRSVPVVVSWLPLVVEELEVEEVEEVEEVVVDVVEAAALEVVVVFDSEVVESEVVDAAALEGAAAEDAAAVSVVFAAFVTVFSFPVVSLVESVVSVESALLLSSRSPSSRTSVLYSCANHTAPIFASAIVHPPAI